MIYKSKIYESNKVLIHFDVLKDKRCFKHAMIPIKS